MIAHSLSGNISGRQVPLHGTSRRVAVQPMALLSGLFGGRNKATSSVQNRQQRKEEASLQL
jgi:hypothetical protein